MKMKVLVAYYSKTGNTEKVAKAIHDALGAIHKDIIKVSEKPDPKAYDIVFCGFPVQSHSVPVPMQEFLKGIPEGKKVALFSTHGSLRGGKLPQQAIHNALGLLSKAKVIDTFTCRGKVEDTILEMLMKNPEHKAWAEEAQSASLHPDEADLAEAALFARKVIS